MPDVEIAVTLTQKEVGDLCYYLSVCAEECEPLEVAQEAERLREKFDDALNAIQSAPRPTLRLAPKKG